MKPRITLLTLGVDDLERSLAFYRDGLGLASEGIVTGRRRRSMVTGRSRIFTKRWYSPSRKTTSLGPNAAWTRPAGATTSSGG